ncbi:uncharacterized protein C11orf24 [Pseudorasbora parva]|uniref:uncharacterized protein C11orf24 n=1 Tax=Pseudorasbora parva TaxID=51549 RepID=UPI00351E654B
MIMTVHPVLVLLPILGLFMLPCAPMHLKDGLQIVANMTMDNPENCTTNLCPPNKTCSKAIINEEHSLCFLISCPNNTQSFCDDVSNYSHLLDVTTTANTFLEPVPVDNNQTGDSVLSQQSSGAKSSQSSSNITQISASEANISISQNDSTAITTTNLQNTSTENATTADAVPKPATTVPTILAMATTIPTKPAETATIPIKPAETATIPTKPAETATIPIKPAMTTTISKTPAMTSRTTTTPIPTRTNSSATTSTVTTSATVAQTIIPKKPPLPSGSNMSDSISPLVPTTLPSSSSTKPVKTSPIPTSSDKKPTPTTPKTSMSPLVVAPTLPKDIPRKDQAMVEAAGDTLTSHLLNTSSLLAVLLFGLLFFVVTVALFLKQAYESYKRKDYTQVDYLINGMYSDSGV